MPPEQKADAPAERIGRPGDPCVMVIFGASGDLTRRKLIPALYNLGKNHLLSQEFAVIGVAKDAMTTDDFRAKLKQDLQQFADVQIAADLEEWFQRRMYYLTGDFGSAQTFQQLKELLQKMDTDHGTHQNYFYYLAIAPVFFGPVVEQLSGAGLMAEDNQHWRRVIVEKPFGRDLESAKALNKQLLSVANESQIYRIDHYLGKETVQNIMAFRFANGIFEPIWNRRYIDHVQISVAETVGVEQRGYYDTAGALRDMVPNHIMQLIVLQRWSRPFRSGRCRAR
jgi:glucose-6-phosphate 1-dehydrogenase